MIFQSTQIAGAYLLDIDPRVDERGFFARAWCAEEFRQRGLVCELAQANIAWSIHRGTLRGLHFQASPHEEAKLVRCTRGAAYVVAADIRTDSSTHGQWIAAELTAENHRMLYVPPGCAQGYQTLADETEMFYQMSSPHVPGSGRGIRHDDPFFKIQWPLAIACISPADQSWPAYCPTASTRPARLTPALAS